MADTIRRRLVLCHLPVDFQKPCYLTHVFVPYPHDRLTAANLSIVSPGTRGKLLVLTVIGPYPLQDIRAIWTAFAVGVIVTGH